VRILVVGGYGLIGSYVMAHLHAEGHALVGFGREATVAARRFPYATWIHGELARMREPADWLDSLAGIDAVVNCAGALQDSPRDDLRAVHVDACRALYKACVSQKLRRVVHLSAVGIRNGQGTIFNATKLAGEKALSECDLDWVILRPGLVLAPVAYGGTALLRGLAGFPFMIPVTHPNAAVQVISVEDVALAVAAALRTDAPRRLSIDLVAPEATTLGDVLISLRQWLGLPAAQLLSVPAGFVARVADAIAYLGWRSPMRTTSTRQLIAGVTGEPSLALAALGVQPRALAEILAAWPSGVQERWFARLYFLKPASLIGLAGFWLASGFIGLTSGFNSGIAILTSAGLAPALASLMVGGGAIVDISLALAVCQRATAPSALKGMVGVCACYLVGGSIFRPDLWLDPLGPFVKILPAALLALVTLAVMDER